MRHFRILLALCLFSATALAQSTSDDTSGGTFVTPGYQAPSNRQGLDGQTSPSTLPDFGGTVDGTNRDTLSGGRRNQQERPERSRRTVEPGANLRGERYMRPQPSEFQKFVEQATGRMLPMFGEKFFERAGDLPDPVDNVPVAGEYIIGPGDELVIRAWGSIDVDYRAKVDRNGQISLPKVGSFSVAGIRASDIEQHLRTQIGRVFTNFSLSVTLGHLRGVKVFVVGPALRPGVYTLPGQSTMLSAAVAAGGPGTNGSMRRLSLRRDGKVVSELDIYDFLVQGDKSHDIQLAPGDVIVFEPVGPRVALNGTLETPAIYELKQPEEPLANVLRYAGGASILATQNRAQLERVDPSRTGAARSVQQFKLDDAGLHELLRDGDIVTLLEISPQFANAVTLTGHVAQPLRYPYTQGMRITDLIPDVDALITPDFYRRKNLLVQMLDEQEAANSQWAMRHRLQSRTAPPYGGPATGQDQNPFNNGGVAAGRGGADSARDAAAATAAGCAPTAVGSPRPTFFRRL